MKKNYHETVLLNEAVEALSIPADGGVFVDATFGGGGHSRLILQKLGPKGQLFGFDQDEDARANEPADESRFTFVASNFRFLKKMLRLEGVREVDGIVADLGVSSHQIDTPDRGFSYRFDAPLDMRMGQSVEKTAADLLNSLSADALQLLFQDLGEVRNSKTLAQAIVRHRDVSKFRTTGDLVRICEAHPSGERARHLSQVFQALRMEVNDELGALADFLDESLAVLKPGGRLAVITFHSIEDRMVKNHFKSGRSDGKIDQDFFGKITRPWEILTKKAVEPSEKEVKMNPRSRSAQLRVAIKK